MPASRTLAVLGILVLGAGNLPGAPLLPGHLEIRVVECDRETAAFLKNAIDDADQDAENLAVKLDELAQRGSLSQRAGFSTKIAAGGPGGTLLKDKKVEDQLAIDPEMTVELGVHLEAEANQGPHDLTSLRLALEVYTPVKGQRYNQQRTNLGLEFTDRRWTLAAEYGDDENARLALVRTTSKPRPAPERPPLIQSPIRRVEMKFDYYLTTPDDMDTIMKNGKGREKEALQWLRKRAKLDRHVSVLTRPGMRVSVQDQWPYVRHEDNGPFLHEPGVFALMVPYVGPNGKLVDVEFVSDLRREKNRKDDPDFKFRGPRTLIAGVPSFFPGAPADQGDDEACLLIVTAAVTTLFKGRDESDKLPQKTDRSAGPYLERYPVHPALPRLLASQAPGPPAIPFGPFPMDLPPRPPFEKVLLKHGIEFPEGARVRFDSGACKVSLQHTAEGHAAFDALLEKFTPDGTEIP